MKKFYFFLFIVLFSSPIFVFADVRVNEIAWMGDKDSSSNEWIELYNTGSTTVNLSGWSFVVADGDTTITLPKSISAKSFSVLKSESDTALPGIFGNNLSNTKGEKLILKNASGTVQTIDATSGWEDGESSTRETMSWWNGEWITAVPTSGRENSSEDLSQDVNEEKKEDEVVDSHDDGEEDEGAISTHAGSTDLSTQEAPVEIFVDAGRDRLGVPEVELQFVGKAFDEESHDEVENATYLWSFGDGSLEKGDEVHHAYHFAGTYNVVLRAKYRDSESVDRLRVSIEPMHVSISNVEPGRDGFVEVFNEGDHEVNLGGYTLEVESHTFVFPQDTIISRNSKIRFANSVTDLDGGSKGTVSLLLPDRTLLAEKNLSTRGGDLQKKLSVAERKLLALRTSLADKSDTPRQPTPLPHVEKISREIQPVVRSQQQSKQKVSQVDEEGSSSQKNTAIAQTASARDAVIVVKSPESFWDKILHFFFTPSS